MKSLKKISKGMRGLSGFIRHGFPLRFNYDKKNLIDYAFKNVDLNIRSLADLGGIWRIDGAYTFYVLDQYRLAKAYIADTDFTPQVIRKCTDYPALALINDNFGNESVLRQIGQIDAVLMFDILLHQVKPDWNEILKMYAKISRVILIYNQQYIGADKTVRLLDLGKEQYLAMLPFARKNPLYRGLFENLDQIHPGHNRPWRDIHNIWQWGITDQDLKEEMSHLGFEQKFYKNHGQFGNLRHFENHVFIFTKR